MLHRSAATALLAAVTALATLSGSRQALAQPALGSAFTYQGQLSLTGAPVEGSCDLTFGLFAAASGGAALGTQPVTGVTLSSGLFTVQLDFGPGAFAGSERWLEIAARCPSGAGSFTTLSPRQPLTAAPYALWTAVAGGVPASGISGTILDSQVSDTLTASNLISSSAVVSDAEVEDTITLTNLEQITNRALASTTGNLDPDRLSGDGTDDDRIDSALLGPPLTILNGNVGIGTTNPGYKLHVVGENLRVEGNTTGTMPRFSLNFTGGLPDEKRWQNYATTNRLSFTALNDAEDAETFWMLVTRGTGTAISSVSFPTGKVGILTTNPATLLQVGSTIVANSEGMIRLASRSGAGASQRHWDIGVPEGDEDVTGKFYSFVIDDPMLGTQPEMVIRWDTGNVGIGRVATSNKLEVEGNASKTTAGDWLANSDSRLKTDIQEVDHALDVIGKLRPVKFHYTEEYKEKHPAVGDHYYYNYVAQEYRQVFPDSVQEDGKGFLQMDGHNASVFAVKALQELHQIVKEKGAEIAAQKSQIQALEARLAMLEEAVRSTASAQWSPEQGAKR